MFVMRSAQVRDLSRIRLGRFKETLSRNLAHATMSANTAAASGLPLLASDGNGMRLRASSASRLRCASESRKYTAAISGALRSGMPIPPLLNTVDRDPGLRALGQRLWRGMASHRL